MLNFHKALEALFAFSASSRREVSSNKGGFFQEIASASLSVFNVIGVVGVKRIKGYSEGGKTIRADNAKRNSAAYS